MEGFSCTFRAERKARHGKERKSEDVTNVEREQVEERGVDAAL
jgi:hypothetical protein